MTTEKKIEELIQKGEQFLGKQLTKDDPSFQAWNASLIRFSERTYGVDAYTTNRFKSRRYTLSMYFNTTPQSDFVKKFEKELKITLEELKILLEEEKENVKIKDNITDYKNNTLSSKKVFIVHGRDEAKKYEIQGFLYEHNLEPIILHRQVNSGKTLIEKFEENSDVACAIILFTPDDVGRLKDADESELKTRARQNVVFEAGYFMGKLGRNRVIFISGVEETMSDINGIVYLNIDNYQYDLEKELKHLKLIK